MSPLEIVLRRAGIICAFICWFSLSVAADPIRLTRDTLVQARATAETVEFGDFDNQAFENNALLGLVNIGVNASTPPPEFGLPLLADSTATQQTDVSVTRWAGTGTADAFAADDPSGNGRANAESVLFVDFTLAEPMSYRFTGTATGAPGEGGFQLDGPMGLGWLFETGNAVPLVAMRRGLLSPGDYVFRAFATTNASIDSTTGRSGFDMEFTLNPVPEPSTLLLFSTGAAYLGRTAWRRRREQSATKL